MVVPGTRRGSQYRTIGTINAIAVRERREGWPSKASMPSCAHRHGWCAGRMKFLPLIWYGLWRKPGRTVLIFLQVCVAFALFGVLQGLKTGVQHAVDAARADLLIVHSRLS